MKKQEFTVGGEERFKKLFLAAMVEKGYSDSQASSYFDFYLCPSNIKKGITAKVTEEDIHYALPQDWIEAEKAFEEYYREEPEYVELLKYLCGYKKGDVAKVAKVVAEEDCYIVNVPFRISDSSHRPDVAYQIKDTKPSTKEAFEAQLKEQEPKPTLEEVKELIGRYNKAEGNTPILYILIENKEWLEIKKL